MNNGPVNPFSEGDYNKLNAQLRDLENLQTEIHQAALAGCDIGNRPQLCQAVIDGLRRFKQTYWPDRP